MTKLVQIGVDPLYFSMAKLFEKHIAAIAKEPISYGGQTIPVKPLVVSPLIFQPYSCPSHCGACCVRATLDYIPGEERPDETTTQMVEVNGRKITFFSDTQLDHNSTRCRHLTLPDARCGIYSVRPFSCDFAVMNVNEYDDHRLLFQRKFGRYWLMKQVDGTKGTKCEKIPLSLQDLTTVHRRLGRLIEWADYFQISNWGQEIRHWLLNVDPEHPTALRLGFNGKSTVNNTATASGSSITTTKRILLIR